MHIILYFVLLLSLLATQVTFSLAIRAEIPGRCQDVCSTDVEAIFFSCVDEISSGCALQLCDEPQNSVKCALKSGIPDTLFTGEELSLFDFRVSRSMTTNIRIQGLTPKIDVYFLIDGTGSMGAAIVAFRRTFLRLTAALGEMGDFAYGLGLFRDETELDMGFRNLQGITTDVALVRESVLTLRSRGGDDTEEANLVALFKIATEDFANWRPGAKRVVLLFGDAVGHEPTCFGDVVLNRRVVAMALRDSGITLQAIGTEFANLDDATIQFGCGNGTAGIGQTSFIANQTGGSLTQLGSDDSPSILSTYTEVLGSTGTVIDISESTCGDGFRFQFEPELPASVSARQALRTTIRLRRRVCRRGSFECSISFKSGESVSQPLTLKVMEPAGCPS